MKVPTVDANGNPLSKAALKNAKRKAKKIAEAANKPAIEQPPSEDEEPAPVVQTAEDAPDAWDEEGEEEAPLTSANGEKSTADNGVDNLTKKVGGLSVSSK